MYLDINIIMTVWLGASLDKVYIILLYTSYLIDYLNKLDIRASIDDINILDHPSHHGHIVYSKVCMHARIHSIYWIEMVVAIYV